MTVSSDKLVTSQYMNGFKTATLAEISTNNNFIAIHSISATNTFILSLIKAHFTLTKHQDNTTLTRLADDTSLTELEYYPTTYPDALTSFQCSSEHAHIFDFVFIKMNASAIMQTDPTNTAKPGCVGELRIGLESLKHYLTFGMSNSSTFHMRKRGPLPHNNTLVILKTNIRLIDSKGHQLDTVMMRNHLVRDRTVNMQHSLVHLPMSRLMDFSRHPTATQITICSYCFHHYGLGSDAVLFN